MLEHRSAVITGSSLKLGIGYAIADALAAQGCNVMLSGRRAAEAAQPAIDDISCHSVQIAYRQTDLSKPGDIRGLIDAATETFGAVDIMVNNAGTNHPNRIEDLPAADWDDIIAVNLSAAYHAIHHVLPQMKERNWGRIINIASTLGLVGYPTVSAYTASKHGLVGLTKAVALETAETGITCNAICPGYTKTELLMRVIAETADMEGVSVDEMTNTMVAADQPAKVMVPHEHFGPLAVLLCSEAGAQIRGTAMPIDGGWTAK